MKISHLSTAVLLSSLVSGAAAAGTAEPVLDERLMEITRVSAKLSALAYQANAEELYAVEPPATQSDNGGGSSGGGEGEGEVDAAATNSTTSPVQSFAHPDMDYIHFYTNEPDQAIVARKDGRCYIAFRGTNINLEDWEQNIDPGDRLIYRDGDTSQPGCESRRGFSDYLQTPEQALGRADIMSCIATCRDPADCLVITGHSQGGATAVISSIMLYSQLPTVITFGQPPAVDPGCEWIPSERMYRYVNSKVEMWEDDDLAFDMVPYSPSLISGSVHYGHMLLLGDDVNGGSNIKYGGFDEEYFEPDMGLFNFDLGFLAHTMAAADADYSYESRINNLVANGAYPVPLDGFSDGAVCEDDYSELCKSGWCLDNICTPKIKELCVRNSCDRNYECETGYCVRGACAAGPGEVEGGCPCSFNRQCVSGDCDTSLTSLNWVCEMSAGSVAAPSEDTMSAGSAATQSEDTSGAYMLKSRFGGVLLLMLGYLLLS